MPVANWSRTHAIRRMESSVDLLDRVLSYLKDLDEGIETNRGWWEEHISVAAGYLIVAKLGVKVLAQALREGVPPEGKDPARD